MNERHEQLLVGLIEQYIKTGQPQGSGTLARELHLDISPATIRNVLNDLDQAGYIYQPRTSAGRVPTDAGYRYYVDHVVTGVLQAREQQRVQRTFRKVYRQQQHRQRTAAKVLATLANTVAVTIANNPGDIHEAGMREFLGQLESEDAIETAREVTAIIDLITDRATEFMAQGESDSRVLIGTEIPHVNAQHASLIIRSVRLPQGGAALVMITGPKRMAYQRNRALVDYIAENHLTHL